MLDAADVLVHRQPVVHTLVHHLRCARTGVADVIPGRIDEGVHGVGLAPRGLAAMRAGAIEKRPVLVQWIARTVRHQVLGQRHRQILDRYRYCAAIAAVDDGNRRTPVALARDAPVAQAPYHLLAAKALGAQVGGDGIGRLLVVEAVVLARIDATAVLGVLGIPRLGY